MFLNKKCKSIIAIILSLAIVVSGITFIFPSASGDFLEIGSEAKAAPLYYYYKYSTVPLYSFKEEGYGYYGYTRFVNAYSSYSFNNRTGTFSYTGYGIYDETARPVYQDLGSPNGLCVCDYTWYRSSDGWTTRYVVYRSYLAGEQAGDIIATNITAVEGTYPDNGKHTDGYWYIKKSMTPILTVSSPTQNGIYSETDSNFIPQILVDNSINESLTCKYYIDSEITPRDIKTVSNSTTSQAIVFNYLNMSTLSEGSHILKYELNNGKMATPITQTVNFKVDKSAPTPGTFNAASTVDTIAVAISGPATDTIGGLDPNPYRYTVGTEVSPWGSAMTYTSLNNLVSNQLYQVKVEARDVVGHIASSTQNIYTKAAVPSLTVNNASSYTLDITSTDNNLAETQYMISANNGTQYVTQEGTLTATPVWVTLTGKKVTVKGLNPSSTYTFSAKARNAENIETAVSSSVSGTTLIAPPASPANLIATATDRTVTVSWEAVSGASGYDIEVDGTILNNDTATAYTHTGLNPGTPHTYRVRAKNEGGPGTWSSPITKSTLPGSPNIPVNLNAIPLSTSITVTWNNVPGATGYDIEVDGELVSNGPNTNYIHNSLTPGTHHSYRVRSINPGGKSEWSGYANATTLLESVPVPVNVTTVPTLSNITLSWDAVTGASGYDVEVDGVTYDNSVRTAYTHNNLAPGTQHLYRVRAKKGGINSEWSAAVVASTLTNAFGTPASFKANANDTSVELSWAAVPDATGYDLEIDGIVTDNGPETTGIHSGLEPNSSHTYRVRARSAAQNSEWTDLLTIVIFTLRTPENVTAEADQTSISIAWNPVETASTYDIEFDGSIITGIQATTYSAIGLAPNTQHIIKVRAVNGGGTSNWSAPLIQATKFAMGNVPRVSGLAKKTSIVLMWNKLEGAASYEVEADGVVTSNIQTASFNVTGLTSGTQHTYRVRAQNSSGAGEWSLEFKISTLREGPAIPSNVATSSNMTSILVTWDKVAGATEYEIEADGRVINNGTGTSYLQTALTPDTSHSYRVRSKSITGYSDWSTLTTVNTLSSVQTFEINSDTGEEFDLVLSASNIQDLNKYTFTIQYDTNDFEVTDLCGFTAKLDTLEGDISGTDITVKQLAPGTIVFTKAGSEQSWQVWSGIVNSITLKAKHAGNATVTYTIQ